VYAVDPVCGMQVERAHAPASYDDGQKQVYFCSERCHDHYLEKVS
jgi:YHS domain-containing protein